MAKSEKSKAKSLKKMLASNDLETVEAGLSLFEALYDAATADELLDGVEYIPDSLYGTLVPNSGFKGKTADQPLRNHVLLGVIRHAPEVSRKASDLKERVTRLGIELPVLSHLSGLPNLNSLKLYDQSRTLKDLKGIEGCAKLERLDISGCKQIEDISAISALPISAFLFKNCESIASLEALKGKRDSQQTRLLDLRQMDQLKSLEGIEFYSALEVIVFGHSNGIERLEPLQRLKELKYLTNDHWPTSNSIYLKGAGSGDPLITPEATEVRFFIGKGMLENPLPSRNLKRLTVGSESMSSLDWIVSYPSLEELTLYCGNLSDIGKLKELESLRTLELHDCRMTDLDALKGKRLRTLVIKDCNELKNLDGLASVTGLKKVSIDQCKKLEDVSGLFESESHQNGSLIFDIEDCPSIRKVGKWASREGMRKLTLDGLFNGHILECFRNSPDLEEVEILMGSVRSRLDGEPLPFRLKFNENEDISLSGSAIRTLTLKKTNAIDLKPLAPMANLESLSIIEAENLTSLDGIEGSAGLRELRIEEAPSLTSIEALKHLKGLRHLTLFDCEAITDLSVIRELEELETLRLNSGKKLTVKPRVLTMLAPDVFDFRMKFTASKGVEPAGEWTDKAGGRKASDGGNSTVERLKTIRKMLETVDFQTIDSIVRILEEADDETLYDCILSGTACIDGRVANDRLFDGVWNVQPFLELALLRILASACRYGKWRSFTAGIKFLKPEKFDNLSFEAFTGLQELHLKGKLPENGLVFPPSLRTLKIEKTESFDFSCLSPCKSLRSLSVETNSLPNGLTGLDSMKVLRLLDLEHSDTGFDTLTPLAHCGELESLTLEYTGEDTWKVKDIGELSRLTGLKKLDLDKCTFEDSRFLKGLSGLTDISISGNDRVAELHLPDDGQSLKRFSIYKCRSLESIVTGRLPRELEHFKVSSTAIRRLPSLAGVETILEFGINTNKNLTDLDEMKGLSGVNGHLELNLGGCRGLKDISGISKLMLAKLVLDTARIPEGGNGHVGTLVMKGLESLEGIGRFPSLRYLDISGNEYLRELTGLRDAVRVVTLKASKCPSITSLEGLQHLKELDHLDIVDLRNLKDIGAVRGLTIGKMFIAGSNFKKADFPPHLQPGIDSTSKPY